MKKTKLLAFALAVVMIFSTLSVSAFAAFAPLTKAEVEGLKTDSGATVRYNKDLTAESIGSPQDGNPGSTKVTIYGAGEGGTDLVLTGSANSNIVKNIANVGRNPGTDPLTNTAATVFTSYCASDDSIRFGVDNTLIVNNQEFWVVKSGDSWQVVEEGTAGAFKAKAAVNDDNNCMTVWNGTAISLVDNIFVSSITFRYTGVARVRPLMPCFRYNDKNVSYELGYIDPADQMLTIMGKKLAYVSTEAYHNITAKYYAACTDEVNNLWSAMADIYLDGIMVYSGIAVTKGYSGTNLVDAPESIFKDNGMSYIFHAMITPFYNSDVDAAGTMKDTLYVKNLQEYYLPAAKEDGAFNYFNSGDTIEGYAATLASNIELNFFVNLLPDVAADPAAEVQFTIDDEVVATQKIADVTPEDDGIYVFTCPVNSTQMTSEIKISFKSGETTHKIFMFGQAFDEYSYSLAEYASTLLADTESSAEVKAVVKAMLNYGAYAQTYFAAKNGTTAGDLANAGFEYTAAELAAATFGTGTVTGATAGMTATLVLDTDTVIKIYKDDVLVGQSAGITADKLNEDVEINCGDTTVKVSVLTLAGKVPATNANFKNLANALALYSAATEAYEVYINSLK